MSNAHRLLCTQKMSRHSQQRRGRMQEQVLRDLGDQQEAWSEGEVAAKVILWLLMQRPGPAMQVEFLLPWEMNRAFLQVQQQMGTQQL